MTNGSLMQTPNTPNLYSEMVANDEGSPLASQAA
jgi:hypothetical protein